MTESKVRLFLFLLLLFLLVIPEGDLLFSLLPEITGLTVSSAAEKPASLPIPPAQPNQGKPTFKA
jgi:hypothetical protein